MFLSALSFSSLHSCRRAAWRVDVCLIAALLAAFPVAMAAQARGARTAGVAGPAATAVPISLDGTWQLLPDPQERFALGALPTAGWRPVRVPLSIQAQFPDLRDFAGVAWYRRSFIAPRPPAGGRILLHFGAADYLAEVYVNGQRVGAHEGGYTPFDLDITAACRQPRPLPGAPAGASTLLVKIADPPGPPADFAASYAQIPHGKQNWYVQTSGLWQSVALAVKPAAYLEWAHVLTDGNRLRGFELRIAHADRLPAGASAALTVIAPDGKAIRRRLPLDAAEDQTLPFPLAQGQWWSPEHPRLYRFTIALSNGDRLADQFGFRSIAVREGRIYLNGAPLYLRGALDQAFYPDGVYTPPSLDALRREMRLGRQLGLNLLRCHIKTPDPRYLRAADETGMLIWYEIPNWDKLTDLAQARSRAMLEEVIARDWNHPSLILQSIINESWGADLKQPRDRLWLAQFRDWAKQHLPDRLVVDNSACCGNFHLKTDLADFHNYDSMPDDSAPWDAWIKDFASRPRWLFSPYGDAQATGAEPLVVSEFGNWGLPQLPAALPWWFSRAFNGNPLTRPAGVFERLRQAGLGRAFGSYGALATATQWHEWQALRHEIESMRLEAPIQGYVITEFTDVNWESNGLLTLWRQPKAFSHELAALQQPIVVIARANQPDYRPGETARVALWVSNESPAALAAATIRWAGRPVRVPAVAAGGVVAAGAILVPIRRSATGDQILPLALADRRGRVLNERTLPLHVIANPPPALATIAVDDPSLDPSLEGLAQQLRRRYRLAASAPLLITGVWDQRGAQTAAAGGAVIVLAQSAAALPASAPLQIVARRGNLRGDWISNFNWLDTSRPPFAPFRSLGGILGFAGARVVPRFLMQGVPPANNGDTLAGFFLGWVHDSYALAVQARHGRGKVLITTLPLSAAYGADPMATAMLDGMIRYIRGDACAPRLEF